MAATAYITVEKMKTSLGKQLYYTLGVPVDSDISANAVLLEAIEIANSKGDWALAAVLPKITVGTIPAFFIRYLINYAAYTILDSRRDIKSAVTQADRDSYLDAEKALNRIADGNYGGIINPEAITSTMPNEPLVSACEASPDVSMTHERWFKYQ